MAYETLKLEVADGLATVSLDRPDAANSIDLTLARELLDAAITVERDRSVRCVLLRGEGPTFCVGGDLRAFASANDLPRLLREITVNLHGAIAAFARLDAPVVAAVHGSAAGAGFSLAVSSDLVVAAESARFVLAYSRVGLTPDGSASWFLPRLVGLRRALDLALTNRMLSAAEAADWGLVTEVVPDADLNDLTRQLAAELATGPTLALGGAKRLLRQSFDHSLEPQMEEESHRLAASAATEDGREGIEAFLAKRSPEFRGR